MTAPASASPWSPSRTWDAGAPGCVWCATWGNWQRIWKAFPAGARLILQRYVAYEAEAGVFYVRMPGEAQGADRLPDAQILPLCLWRRPLDAAGTDPGRPSRRPRAAPLPAAPCSPAGRRPGGGGADPAGLRRQPQPGQHLPRRHPSGHAGDDRPLRRHRPLDARSSGSAASISASPISSGFRPERTSPSWR